MMDFRRPHTKEMVEAYTRAKSTGLQNIRLGNLGVFVHNDEDRDYLMANINMDML
jgi:hypothetical protein